MGMEPPEIMTLVVTRSPKGSPEREAAEAWLAEWEGGPNTSPMVVYLAGHHMADAYRVEATRRLINEGHAVIDPMRDEHDYRGLEGDNVERIVEGDLRDVVDCTHVLANFSQNSVGTSMECWFAMSIRRPVVSFVDLPDQRISPWVHYISQSVHIGLDDALDALCGLA